MKRGAAGRCWGYAAGGGGGGTAPGPGLRTAEKPPHPQPPPSTRITVGSGGVAPNLKARRKPSEQKWSPEGALRGVFPPYFLNFFFYFLFFFSLPPVQSAEVNKETDGWMEMAMDEWREGKINV